MNFLKISGLVIGTVGVSGVAGVGIHYSTNSNNTLDKKNIPDNFEVKPHIHLNDQDDDLEIEIDSHKNIPEGTVHIKEDKKTLFNGKIVFYKKTGTFDNATYEVRLINISKYNKQKKIFDTGKDDTKKYDKINKIVDVSCQLNFVTARDKLKEIIEKPSSISDIKVKLKSKENELKKLFGEGIYQKLQAIT